MRERDRRMVERLTPKDRYGAANAGLTRDTIDAIAGKIDDAKVAAIERSGATTEQLEEAGAWAAGLSGVMGKQRRPLSGGVGRLHEILTADEEFEEDRQ